MRKIAATYVYPLTRTPIKSGILVCNNDGTVVEIIDRGEHFREEAGVEYYSGILAPGFVHFTKLLSRDKVFFRKLWAAGIALVVDKENRIYAGVDKNSFQIEDLGLTAESYECNPAFDNDERLITEQLLAIREQNKTKELNGLIGQLSLQRAHAFNLGAQYGSFEAGKRPGVNLITGIDYKKMELTPKSKIKRLL